MFSQSVNMKYVLFHFRNIHIHMQNKTPKKKGNLIDMNPSKVPRGLEKSSNSSLSEIHSIEFSSTVILIIYQLFAYNIIQLILLIYHNLRMFCKYFTQRKAISHSNGTWLL